MKPTSSERRSPCKSKRGTVAGGIVIPKHAILVNQRLKKIKLEEDYVDQKPDLPVSMEIHPNPNCTDVVLGDGEAVTEDYQVTKVEADIVPMSSEDTPPPNEDGGRHDHTAREEMEALKRTMKQLSLQMTTQKEAIKKQDERIQMQNETIKKQDAAIKKQNEVISGVKSFIRSIGLSMVTFLSNDEEEENGDGRRHGNNEESPAKHYGSTAEDSLVLGRPSCGAGSPCGQSGVIHDKYDNSQDDAGHCTEHGNMNVDGDGVQGNEESSKGDVSGCASEQNQEYPSGSPETSSNQGGVTSEQNAPDGQNLQANDDIEGESATEMGEDGQENQIELAKTSAKINKEFSTSTTTVSTANLEGSFGCSKCGKNFKSEILLGKHMYNPASKCRPQVNCHLCPKACKSIKGVDMYIRLVHKDIRYKCAYCPGTFFSGWDAVEHEKSVHRKGATPTTTQQCKICGLQLNSNKSLLGHVYRMHERKKKPEMARALIFRCHHCYAIFTELNDIQCHLRQSHGIPPGKGCEK